MEKSERCERVLAVLACAGSFAASIQARAMLHSAGIKEPRHPETAEGGSCLEIADWWM